MSESLGIEIKWTKKGCGNKIWFIRLKAEMQDFYIFLSFMLNTSLFKYERKAIHGKKKKQGRKYECKLQNALCNMGDQCWLFSKNTEC